MKNKLLCLLCVLVLCCCMCPGLAEDAEGTNETIPSVEATVEQQEEVRLLSQIWLNLTIPEDATFASEADGRFIYAFFGPSYMVHINKYSDGEISALHLSCMEYDETASLEHLTTEEKLQHFKACLEKLPAFQQADLVGSTSSVTHFGYYLLYSDDERDSDQLKWQYQLLITGDGSHSFDNKLVLINWDPLLNCITDVTFKRLDF